MPSGSRRKKASKKKKGNDTNNSKSSATLHSTENDDLRNQEERDSDGGENEAVSPVSEGNNQDHFPEGGSELEDREKLPSFRSVASENIVLEGDTVNSKEVYIVGLDSEENEILEENVKEVKQDDAPESGSVDVVCDENVEVPTNEYHEDRNGIELNGEPRFDVEYDWVKPESAILEAHESGNSVGYSQFSSFDKDIHDATDATLTENLIDSGSDLKENGEKEFNPRDYSSEIGHNVLDVSLEVGEGVESVADVSERVVHVTEPVPDETILDSASELKENEEKELQTRDYTSQVSQTPVEVSSNVEEYILTDFVTDVKTCLDKVESIHLVSENVIHVPETAPVKSMVDSGSVLMENGEDIDEEGVESVADVSERVVHVTEPVPDDTILGSAAELKENEEKELQTRDYSSQVSQTPVEVSSNDEAYILSNSVTDVETCLDKVESIHLVSEKVIHVPETAPVKSMVDSGSVLMENGEEIDEEGVESVADISERVVHVTEPVPDETILDCASDLKENEEKELQTRDYSSQVSQTSVDTHEITANILSDSVTDVETCLDKVEPIHPVSEKFIHVPETAPVKSIVDSGSVSMENGEEVVAPVESLVGFDKAVISEKVIYVNGTAPTEKVDEDLHTGDCSAQTPSILLDISSKDQESAAKLSSFSAKHEAIENDDRSLPISDSSTVHASSSVESSKEPESCEISENQTVIATPPRQVEKTSWFGCCGIFDLISGTR